MEVIVSIYIYIYLEYLGMDYRINFKFIIPVSIELYFRS